MSRPKQVRCAPCGGKVIYRTDEKARAALGCLMVGRWRDSKDAYEYSLCAYRCPVRPRNFHLGHNPATIKVIESDRRRHAAHS